MARVLSRRLLGARVFFFFFFSSLALSKTAPHTPATSGDELFRLPVGRETGRCWSFENDDFTMKLSSELHGPIRLCSGWKDALVSLNVYASDGLSKAPHWDLVVIFW